MLVLLPFFKDVKGKNTENDFDIELFNKAIK
jgi:hypothetical protein